MRILQIVAYISPNGAYGGPVRVALNQAKALTALGHEVIVAAAGGGFIGPLPQEFDDFPVHLFPARRVLPKTGFAGLTSPQLLAWLPSALRGADVVHVHMARDFITLPAAVLALGFRKPLVLQTHGMVDASSHPLAAPLDYFITIPLLFRASTVLYLTERERTNLILVAQKGIYLEPLANGMVVGDTVATEQVNGASPFPEVLYLARLHARKRPVLVVEAAHCLKEKWPLASWTIIGPDEGEGNAIKASIAERNLEPAVSWAGPLAPGETLVRMQDASVYVLPSINEPFPMSVLEAMSIGVPVVVTETNGLAPVVRQHRAGIVCDHSQESFTHAVDTLIGDPELRVVMGANGRHAVRELHSMEAVATRLVQLYENALERKNTEI